MRCSDKTVPLTANQKHRRLSAVQRLEEPAACERLPRVVIMRYENWSVRLSGIGAFFDISKPSRTTRTAYLSGCKGREAARRAHRDLHRKRGGVD